MIVARRVAVTGRSMTPTFTPGDRLLVVRTRRVKPGDLVAVRDPRDPANVMVKRILRITPDRRLDVRGDNPNESTDSREFGAVDRSSIVGRVVYRYFPRERVGRIRR